MLTAVFVKDATHFSHCGALCYRLFSRVAWTAETKISPELQGFAGILQRIPGRNPPKNAECANHSTECGANSAPLIDRFSPPKFQKMLPLSS
jgi:hypothetical protein